jgi:4-hydroxybenzoate polyprenyltransferase
MSVREISAIWRSLRPAQWTKNLFVFLPLVFGGRLLDVFAFNRVFLAALLFCMVSSSTYLINDILDIKQDRLHPRKRNRPLANGELKLPWAYATSFLLLLVSVLGSGFCLSWLLAAILAGYWILVLSYSLILKDLFLFDIAIVIAGFVLRIKAGASAIPIPMSTWLVLCTLLLALFLVLGKRRQELEAMKQIAPHHRRVLKSYDVKALNVAIVCAGIAAAACYTLYTFRQDIHPHRLIGTSLFVWIGIGRYAQLLLFKGQGEDASYVLLTDRPVLLSIVLWFGALVWILYVQ